MPPYYYEVEVEIQIPHLASVDIQCVEGFLIAAEWTLEFWLLTEPPLIPIWPGMLYYHSPNELHWHLRKMALLLLGSGESPSFPLGPLWYQLIRERESLHYSLVGVEVQDHSVISTDSGVGESFKDENLSSVPGLFWCGSVGHRNVSGVQWHRAVLFQIFLSC